VIPIRGERDTVMIVICIIDFMIRRPLAR